MVSPFENPFPTRGRGPWTPKGGSGQSMVSPHTIYRPRCTDRQLLGVGRPLASYYLLRTAQGCALVVTPESRRLALTVIPSEQREPRDLHAGISTAVDCRALPWGRPHEGIPVLCQTTFAFQRVKPIVVSPFENPLPDQGRGPWTPRGAADSRWFLHIPSTGRDAPTASCSVLLFYWHRVTFWGQGRGLFSLVAGIPGWRSLGSQARSG